MKEESVKKYYLESPDLLEKIEKFKEEIYFYCDCNAVCSESLFPVFRDLWPESEEISISRKDLTTLTSHILNDLIDKGVLEINRSRNNSIYAFYKILPHEPLINYSSFIDKKRELKFN
jgi:hypothetical protein